ncbi:hypothetical protein MPG16_05750 [Helicobacter pylori]|uniref:hypothetical protein n=1 Tax=Helicobacter pylori TaxID=210 RepID=UPI001FD70308|nr:hypothetical protein [Helicobacter pylori]UOS33846.1 hypothetical protein MPG16_05750 [Helicobacter pylori]
MRVTFGSKYNQMNNYQNALQNKINDANTQIASGLKIRYGYQTTTLYCLPPCLNIAYDISIP